VACQLWQWCTRCNLVPVRPISPERGEGEKETRRKWMGDEARSWSTFLHKQLCCRICYERGNEIITKQWIKLLDSLRNYQGYLYLELLVTLKEKNKIIKLIVDTAHRLLQFVVYEWTHTMTVWPQQSSCIWGKSFRAFNTHEALIICARSHWRLNCKREKNGPYHLLLYLFLVKVIYYHLLPFSFNKRSNGRLVCTNAATVFLSFIQTEFRSSTPRASSAARIPSLPSTFPNSFSDSIELCTFV